MILWIQYNPMKTLLQMQSLNSWLRSAIKFFLFELPLPAVLIETSPVLEYTSLQLTINFGDFPTEKTMLICNTSKYTLKIFDVYSISSKALSKSTPKREVFIIKNHKIIIHNQGGITLPQPHKHYIILSKIILKKIVIQLITKNVTNYRVYNNKDRQLIE